ncbi:acyl-CoA thioesterase [Sinobacterium caligoides]|nr:hotdog domain-containing protein [Sinobacterium caligoides]
MSEPLFRTRKIISYPDLNAAGKLFGGTALAWIDEESAIFASCVLGNSHLVTVHMSEINFKSPGELGEIVEIGTKLVKVGKTSITVSCQIRHKATKQDIITVDKVVFVSIDDKGNPLEHGYQGE